MARYPATEFPQIQALIPPLDGGYLDMEKILPLEEELGSGTLSFMRRASLPATFRRSYVIRTW
ncbi:MAG: hypothetical protein ACLRZG_11500 [Streptococcus sp.]